MIKEIDFANWLINIQRIESCQYMSLDELYDMYKIYEDYIEQEIHTPHYK
jgi:hypothetical protein